MASNLDSRLPQALDCADLARDWPKWKQSFLIYLIAADKMQETEKSKIALFLWLVGQRGMEIFNTLFPNDGSCESMFGREDNGAQAEIQPDADAENAGTQTVNRQVPSRTLNDVIKAFDEYCLPKRNAAMEAFKFNRIEQKEKQTFGEFETALRTQLQYCEFECGSCHASYADRMLKDRIIIGIQDKKLQMKLLDGKNDPLSKITETCKIFEAASVNKQLLERQAMPSMEIKAVTESNDNHGEVNVGVAAIRRSCYNCGQMFNGKHRRFCPAVNIKCNACGKTGHFARFCKQSQEKEKEGERAPAQQRPSAGKVIHTVNWCDSGMNYTNSQYTGNEKRNYCRVSNVRSRIDRLRWKKRFIIQDWPIEFKIDTGADVNCIPIGFVRKINAVISENTDCDVIDYSSNSINVHGQVSLRCFDAEHKVNKQCTFLVVDDCFEPILGLESSVSLGLIKRVNAVMNACPAGQSEFLKENADLFDGIGQIPGRCSIVLKPNSVPTLHYKKRIPPSLHDRLREKLKEMLDRGIISSVEYPTEWINNLQLVEKPGGDLRICLDPKPLNACIKREHFLIPTLDDILGRLSGKRVFTVLDPCNGFWHLTLDRASSDLTTFMTPFGRYRWKRVPFGLNNAPEMFQRKMVQIFGDIPGVEVYFDDIAVAGETADEHDRALALVLERARSQNVRFNSKKIQYRTNRVQFMGHVIADGNVRPTCKYIEAIREMPRPENKSDVLRLLGLFKYLSRFIPNLSQRTAALRELTRNDVEWSWTASHEQERLSLLSCISDVPVLSIFDPDVPIENQTDSSKDGLGSVLLQGGRPVAYAPRTLTKCEQKWAQIEKELLAIVFACARFHYFLYGRDFVVQSDHKPLESLIKRDIDDVTPRLQRMFLQLLKYPGLEIRYTPGREMHVADCLSRAPLMDSSEFDPDLSMVIHSVTRRVCMSEENYRRYVQALNGDVRYGRLIKYVTSGWPSYHQLDDLGQLFHRYKDELHFENNLLLRNHRLVVPGELQSQVAKWIHAPHFGIEKTLASARSRFFWPGMSRDLTEVVRQCIVCEKFTRANQKEPLVQDSTPEYPFQRISVDLYEYAGHDFVAVIDAYSGFLMSRRLADKSARQVIRVLDDIFCAYGYPTQIRSDNVPFGSREFEMYASEVNVVLKFSSPRYPQSNGLAEKGVAIAKNVLKRCYEVGDVSSFQYRLLEYNCTPVAGMKLSPSELFFGRLTRNRMPIAESQLQRNTIPEGEVQRKMEEKKKGQRMYYDRGSKLLPVLNVGDRVMFRKNGREWHYGKIVRKVNERSYIILDQFENYFRRNRRFIVTTVNRDFNASELLVENERGQVPVECRELLSEVEKQTASPVGAGEQELARGDRGDAGLADASGMPVIPDVRARNDELPRDTSPPLISDPECAYRTRSGREVRPPRRYGFE